MKLFIVLTLAACAHGDKLDNTYLPPSYAKTSGGSGIFLQTPLPGPSRNGFSGINNGFIQNDVGFAPNINGFAPNVNGFAPTGNRFAPSGNRFAPSGNPFARFVGFNGVVNRSQRPQAAFERNAAITRQYNNNDGESYAYGYETENGISAEESGVATNGVEAQGGYSYTGDDGRIYSVRYTADQNGFRPVGDHLPTPPPVPEEIQKALDQNARDEAAGIFDDGSYNDVKYGTVGSNRVYPEANQIFPTNQKVADDDTVVTNSALFLDNDVIRPPGYKNQIRNQGRNQGQIQGIRKPQGSQGQSQAFQPQRFQSSVFQPQRFQSPVFQPQVFRPLTGINANKEYLPPFAQSNFGRRNQNGGRYNRPRPSFDDVNGYRY